MRDRSRDRRRTLRIGGRSRRWPRSPAGPRSVSVLCPRRVRHVPQRPLPRAGDQGARPVWRRARRPRAGIRGQGRSGLRLGRRPGRARGRPREGLRADRSGGRASVPSAGERVRDRCRPHRTTGGAARRSAGPPRARPRSCDGRSQAGAGRRCSGACYHSGSVREACASAEPDIVVGCIGAPEVVEAIQSTAPGAIVCLTGLSPRGRALSVDIGS
jgi:hypothetical protein